MILHGMIYRMQREQSVTRPSATSPYTDVHGKYPDPWKVGVIKRMRKQCIPGSFFPFLPKSLGTRLELDMHFSDVRMCVDACLICLHMIIGVITLRKG